jgi:hypothetical protein
MLGLLGVKRSYMNACARLFASHIPISFEFNMVVSGKMGNGRELLLYAWEECSLFGEVQMNAVL